MVEKIDEKFRALRIVCYDIIYSCMLLDLALSRISCKVAFTFDKLALSFEQVVCLHTLRISFFLLYLSIPEFVYSLRLWRTAIPATAFVASPKDVRVEVVLETVVVIDSSMLVVDCVRIATTHSD